VRLPKPKIKIGDWVRVRKIGVDGMYQVMRETDGIFELEQRDGSYTHKVKAKVEELIK
jgi:hypothetical protein